MGAMRIIAGEHRGRRIIGPRDATTTRPITDRVKTRLFDRLDHRGLIADAAVLDVFCGTGTLGLEALSRGAHHVTFIDRDRDALDRLKRNIAALGVGDRATLRRADAARAGWVKALDEPTARLAFVDPPYAMLEEAGGWAKMLPMLEALASAMEPGGVMVLRTARRVDVATITGFDEPTSQAIGSMVLHFYEAVSVAGG